jgi:hypothetical protein
LYMHTSVQHACQKAGATTAYTVFQAVMIAFSRELISLKTTASK